MVVWCGMVRYAVLPSRSAFSDLGVPKLVFFLPEKSTFWPYKSKKSDFHSFSLPHKAKIYLKISLDIEYFQIKFHWLNFKIKFLEKV